LGPAYNSPRNSNRLPARRIQCQPFHLSVFLGKTRRGGILTFSLFPRRGRASKVIFQLIFRHFRTKKAAVRAVMAGTTVWTPRALPIKGFCGHCIGGIKSRTTIFDKTVGRAAVQAAVSCGFACLSAVSAGMSQGQVRPGTVRKRRS